VRDLSLHAGVLCFLSFSYIWIQIYEKERKQRTPA
jgi:hypothetical protein